jgi:hypothetical protein
MNVQEIRNRLDAIVAALTAKGYNQPNADLIVRDGESYTQTRLEYAYRFTEADGTKYETIRDSHVDWSTDPAAFFDEAMKRIGEMPTVREAQIKAFVNSLEDLKSKAEDLEIDADFVNPLAALMQKLATNALTHHK